MQAVAGTLAGAALGVIVYQGAEYLDTTLNKENEEKEESKKNLNRVNIQIATMISKKMGHQAITKNKTNNLMRLQKD